ncbi:MAG: PIG-L family deacetylase [Gammaproteobacteria bacterium]
MNVLIVVAHPDDEVLGCGIAGAALADYGHTVRACFLSGRAEARGGRPSGDQLLADVHSAQRILGFGAPLLGSFPNIRLNTVAHIELVQFIEQAVLETQAEIVFTHHPSDLNDDHVQTSRACQAAVRLFQRRPAARRLRALYFAEILSSSDWAFPGGAALFTPDTFVNGEGYFERKLEALRAYRGVVRPAPHPRSEQVLRGLAQYRGGQCGYLEAEAFQSAFIAGEADKVFGR